MSLGLLGYRQFVKAEFGENRDEEEDITFIYDGGIITRMFFRGLWKQERQSCGNRKGGRE